MKKLYVCYSYYHVYVTLFKAMNNKEGIPVDIIITDQIPNHKELLSKLESANVFNNVIFIDDISRGVKHINSQSKIVKMLNVLNYNRLLKRLYSDVNLSNYDEINLFFDRQHLSQFMIMNHKNIILHEDSRYSPAAFKFNKSYSRILLEKMRLIPSTGGSPESIRKIECSDIDMLPSILKEKFINTEINILEENASEKTIRKVSKVFGFERFEKKEKSCLLLTQPLYQDKLVATQEKQKDIYSKVIEKYCKEYEHIYIKPHPRDEIKYDFNTDDISVLDKNVPFEIYKYFKLDFEKYITLFSTSIRGYDESKIVEVGYQIDPELFENYTRYIKK